MKKSFLSHYQKNLLVFVFSLVSSWLYSQAPTITSFTPTSGAVGSTVTITGSGFSSTPANNIVFFGSVKATVSDATTTQLTVTVPSGAGAGKIKVINKTSNKMSNETSRPFSISILSTGTPTSTAFGSNNSITVSAAPGIGTGWMEPSVIATQGDIDGDGKIDFVQVTGSTPQVQVYLNTSSGPGIFTFAPPFNLTGTALVETVWIEDLNLDGKLDIIMGETGSSTIRIFQNTSTIGTLSFAAPVNITGASGFRLRTGDINNDGLPDLVFSGGYVSTIQAALNTLTSNGGVISFSSASTIITTSSGTRGWILSDFTGDGAPDILNATHGCTVS